MNRKLIAVALIGLASPAMAADLPVPVAPPPVPYYAPVKSYNWSSVYIGGNVGYGYATASLSDDFGDSFNENLTGVIGGGQIGANYQIGALVFGIEADFDASDQTHTGSAFGISETDQINWIGTVRGRIGGAYDRWFFYATAGGGEGKLSENLSTPFGSINASQTHAAWAVGAGIEYGITEYLSARVEYLYLDTGNMNVANIYGDQITGRVQNNLIRAGLNLRLPY
jgi:outer membrane immunogenic protein